MNDSIFTKMMLSLQESKKIETKANLKALKESKEIKNEEVEIEVAEENIEAPLDEVETVETTEEVTESVAQDSQIKTTNKGTEVNKIDGIKPATGEDRVPAEATKKNKKLDSMNENPDVTGAAKEVVTKTNKEKLENKMIKEEYVPEMLCDYCAKEIKEGEEYFSFDTKDGDKGVLCLDCYNAGLKDEYSGSIVINESKELTEDADLSIKTGGRLIEITDDTECEECEELIPATEEPIIDEVEELESTEEFEDDEMLDESTFNPFLTKFIKDNYKNAKAMVVENCRKNKNELVLECKILFNSGKASKLNLGLRGIVREGKVSTLRARDNGYFKAESVSVPFKFKVSYKNNIIKCEGLEYNFKTKLAEGKIKELKGKLVRG